MSNKLTYTLGAALAPMAWGTTYLVATELLPDGRPMLAANALYRKADFSPGPSTRVRVSPYPNRPQ